MNTSCLQNQRIILGVSGGIAAYKSLHLLRLLTRAGADVRVVMTQAATEFVTPLSFQALSGHSVRVALFDAEAESGMDHIALARWADCLLIAPASADLLARCAHGRADDLLTTLVLACAAPLWVAPAMNQQMWRHPAVKENCRILAARGVRFIGPQVGEQACGDIGAGRMSEPEQILQALTQSISAQDGQPSGQLESDTRGLDGRHVVITAGGTQEPIDPVRYIANRSSGKMGFALAHAAARLGATVTLISGPVSLQTPSGVQRVDVTTALEMAEAVAAVEKMDLFIGAAAVADFRVARPAEHKLKKQSGKMGQTLELVENPDIITTVSRRDPRPFVIGFAAETEKLVEYAEQKRVAKNMDLICANQVGPGQGFDQPDNELLLIWSGGRRWLPRADKQQLAFAVLETYQRIQKEQEHASYSS
ncbi:MAG TPA: bifunctional phosphopantothenoylcysteine decarboxylase/phosphopantothenate--cysteine ligase CoaBC [Halothiobacillaceae bacterium]|nr:bifunctional phosphopantothenoylcysteine decarboxylase/phosphopantothenate--cysteine ligase CoaBC [Halothiobacillaceae bacterium]